MRTRTEPAALAETVRQQIHQIEPARSVFDITPLEDHLSEAFSENRLRTVLLSFFAATGPAAVFARLLFGVLYGVSPSDVPTLSAVVLLVL